MSAPKETGASSINLVSRLQQAFQVSRLHSLENVTLEEPVRELTAAVNGFVGEHGYVSFKPDLESEVLFLNEQPVRSRRNVAVPTEGLIKFMGQLGMGELRFLRPTDERLIRLLLALVKERGQGPDPVVVCKRLVAGLEGSELEGLVSILSTEQAAAKAVRRSAAVDERLLVRLAYARTLTLLREYLRHMEDDELNRYFWRRLVRAVQGLQGIAVRQAKALLALTLLKDADDYLINHSVNTCILALLLGQRLGLEKTHLVNCGLAALLHGLGKFRTDRAVMESDEKARTPAQQREYADHPYRAVGAFLETRRLDDAMLTAALVAFQYESDEDMPVTRRPMEETHPTARIVSICEAYDALTTPRPWRPAVLPDRALMKLLSGSPRPFDETLLGLFAGMLGIFPPGSAVQLESGELAFVVHPNPDDPQRPLVAIVRDANGEVVDGDIVDLASKTSVGRYRWAISTAVDPRALGIELPEYMRNG